MRLSRWLAALASSWLIVPTASLADGVTVHEAAQLLTQQTGRSFVFSQKTGARRLSSWGSPREREAGQRDFADALQNEGLTLLGGLGGPRVIVESSTARAARAALAAPAPSPAAHISRGAASLYDFEDREIQSLSLEIATKIGVTLLYDDRLRGKLTLTGKQTTPPAAAALLLPKLLAATGFGLAAGPAGTWAITSFRRLPSYSSGIAELQQFERRFDRTQANVHLSFRRRDLRDLLDIAHEELDIDFAFGDQIRGRVSLLPGRDFSIDEAAQVIRALLLMKGFRAVTGPAGVMLIVSTKDAQEAQTWASMLASRPPLRQISSGRVALQTSHGDDVVSLLRSFSEQTRQGFAIDDRVRGRITLKSRRDFEAPDAFALVRTLLFYKGYEIVNGPGELAFVVPSRDAELARALMPSGARDLSSPALLLRLEEEPMSELLSLVTETTGVQYRASRPAGSVTIIGEATLREAELPDLVAGFLALRGFVAAVGEDGVVNITRHGR